MEKEPSYVVGLIVDKGMVVAVTRRNREGDLGLPGGSIEPTDKSAFDALVREVREETSMEVRVAHHVFSRVDDTDGNVAWAFVVTEWEGTPTTRESGIVASWEKPWRLLQKGCTFRGYNKELFDKLGIDPEGLLGPL